MADQRLIDELQSDPLNRGYSVMTAKQTYDDLQAEYREKKERADVESINRYLLETGLWQKLNATAEETEGQTSTPTAAARAADTLLAASVAPPSEIALDSVGLTVSLDTLVSALAITSEERSGIDALANTMVSRAADLEIPSVRLLDVIRARRQLGWDE